MSDELEALRKVLIEGQRRSMQGSYQRRNPASPAVPFLIEARSGLKKYVAAHSQDVNAWRMLSQAEECLLNYASACRSLEQALNLSERNDKKDLKRLVQLKQYEKKWAELGLSPPQLEELGKYLRKALQQEQCDHSLRFTRQWLQSADIHSKENVIVALRNQGGYCDCEVLSNVVIG